MLKTLQSLQGVSVLSKDAQKKVNGGCGNVATFDDGSRCVVDGISKREAKQNSADFNNGNWPQLVHVTDVNWCCASCGNFSQC